MCLAVPGEIIELRGVALERVGRVSFGGVVKDISLAYVPQAQAGDYVIVHAGFALAVLDETEARRVFELLDELDGSADAAGT